MKRLVSADLSAKRRVLACLIREAVRVGGQMEDVTAEALRERGLGGGEEEALGWEIEKALARS